MKLKEKGNYTFGSYIPRFGNGYCKTHRGCRSLLSRTQSHNSQWTKRTYIYIYVHQREASVKQQQSESTNKRSLDNCFSKQPIIIPTEARHKQLSSGCWLSFKYQPAVRLQKRVESFGVDCRRMWIVCKTCASRLEPAMKRSMKRWITWVCGYPNQAEPQK